MSLDNKRKELAIRELNTALNKLLSDVETYFDKNLMLNSEGMKFFSKIAKALIQLYPELRCLISRARIEPSYESIAKLASRFSEISSPESRDQLYG